jgi:hypothetical protein
MTVRSRIAERRARAIKERLICTLEDEPGELAHRVCKRCGAPVMAYLLKPRVAFNGAGGEVICCTGRVRHYLHAGEWTVTREGGNGR